jgi:hypothetical protein
VNTSKTNAVIFYYRNTKPTLKYVKTFTQVESKIHEGIVKRGEI